MTTTRNKMTPKIVCEVPSVFNPRTSNILMSDSEGHFHTLPFKVAEVKMKKTIEEKLKEKRAYRDDYMKRPHVQEKAKKRLADPELMAKKREYAQRPEVKQRKKELAARARLVRRELKTRYPELYNEILEETIEVNGKK